MALIQWVPTDSTRKKLLQGTAPFIRLDTDAFKCALFLASAGIGPSSTVYNTTGEASSSGTGYTAGGNVFTFAPLAGVAHTYLALSRTAGNASAVAPATLGGLLLAMLWE